MNLTKFWPLAFVKMFVGISAKLNLYGGETFFFPSLALLVKT